MWRGEDSQGCRLIMVFSPDSIIISFQSNRHCLISQIRYLSIVQLHPLPELFQITKQYLIFDASIKIRPFYLLFIDLKQI